MGNRQVETSNDHWKSHHDEIGCRPATRFVFIARLVIVSNIYLDWLLQLEKFRPISSVNQNWLKSNKWNSVWTYESNVASVFLKHVSEKALGTTYGKYFNLLRKFPYHVKTSYENCLTYLFVAWLLFHIWDTAFKMAASASWTSHTVPQVPLFLEKKL